MSSQDFLAFKGEEHHPFMFEGDGQAAALLVHGFPGSPAEMRPVGEALHASGWTARGMLLPGFGREIETLGDRKRAEWLAAIQRELNALRQQHDTILLVGNSMGAALTVETAAGRTQPPDGLILLSPFWTLRHILWRALPIISVLFPKPRIFRYFKLDFDNPEVREGIHNFMPYADLDDPETREEIRDIRMPVSMFAQIRAAGKAAYRLAPKVSQPVLALQGTHDDLSHPDLTDKLLSRFAGSVQYHMFQAGHELTNVSLAEWYDIREKITTFAASLNKQTSGEMG